MTPAERIAAAPKLCPDCYWPTLRTWPETCETCGQKLPAPLTPRRVDSPEVSEPRVDLIWPLLVRPGCDLWERHHAEQLAARILQTIDALKPAFDIELLTERLKVAEARLLLLAHDGGPGGRPRLEAKAEGVRLALSYISDQTRHADSK